MLRRSFRGLIPLFAIAVVTRISATQGAELSPAAANDTLVQTAIDRGRMMYVYDRAAWLTSDDLTTRLALGRQSEVGGWIVTPVGGGLHVDYFGKDLAADSIIYSADIEGKFIRNATVHPATDEPRLSGLAARMTNALRAARAEMERHSDWRSCANAPLNTIVLPPQPNGTIPVYFLTPQTENGSLPFGGHYEIDIASDMRVALARAFTRSCITLTEQRPGADSSPAALFITHLLDPRPTEIHVFEQFYAGIPLYVAIPDPKSVWKVEGGTIQDVSGMFKD